MKSPEKKKPNIEVYNLSIPSIHCQGCIDTLIKAFTQISGIDEVNGNSKTKIITIKIKKDQVTLGEIEKTVKSKGHQLKSMNWVQDN